MLVIFMAFPNYVCRLFDLPTDKCRKRNQFSGAHGNTTHSSSIFQYQSAESFLVGSDVECCDFDLFGVVVGSATNKL